MNPARYGATLARQLQRLSPSDHDDELGSLELPPLCLPPLKRLSAAPSAGAHRGSAGALGVSAFELKPYEQGDELRHLDMRRYARERRLFVRRYEEERAGQLVVVMDASASMGVEPRLWSAALRALCAVSESALMGGNQLTWALERGGALRRVSGLQSLTQVRGRAERLWAEGAQGARAPHAALEGLLRSLPAGSACLYITDLVGLDFELSGELQRDLSLIRQRLPLPLACPWALCLRLEGPRLWEPDPELLDPESGALYQLPARGEERRQFTSALRLHLERWERGLAALKSYHLTHVRL